MKLPADVTYKIEADIEGYPDDEWSGVTAHFIANYDGDTDVIEIEQDDDTIRFAASRLGDVLVALAELNNVTGGDATLYFDNEKVVDAS